MIGSDCLTVSVGFQFSFFFLMKRMIRKNSATVFPHLEQKLFKFPSGRIEAIILPHRKYGSQGSLWSCELMYFSNDTLRRQIVSEEDNRNVCASFQSKLHYISWGTLENKYRSAEENGAEAR